MLEFNTLVGLNADNHLKLVLPPFGRIKIPRVAVVLLLPRPSFAVTAARVQTFVVRFGQGEGHDKGGV